MAIVCTSPKQSVTDRRYWSKPWPISTSWSLSSSCAPEFLLLVAPLGVAGADPPQDYPGKEQEDGRQDEVLPAICQTERGHQEPAEKQHYVNNRARLECKQDAPARGVDTECNDCREQERRQQLHWPRSRIRCAPALAPARTRELAK